MLRGNAAFASSERCRKRERGYPHPTARAVRRLRRTREGRGLGAVGNLKAAPRSSLWLSFNNALKCMLVFPSKVGYLQSLCLCFFVLDQIGKRRGRGRAGHQTSLFVHAAPGTPPWPRRGYPPRRRSNRGTARGPRPRALLRPLWRGRLGGWPNVRLPMPITAFRAQGRLRQLSAINRHNEQLFDHLGGAQH